MQATQNVRQRRQVYAISDGVLAKQALAGNDDAYTMLVQRYHLALFNFICRFLADYDAACDILQQVFLQLYISLPKLRTEEPLKPWLFQVARNRCLDELRRKRVIHFSELQLNVQEDELSPLDTLLDSGPLPEEVAAHHDLQRMLQQAIDTLPSKYRSVVLLRYAAQLSFAEISQTLHMPEATAKTYFQRAKPLLRAVLTEHVRPAVMC